MGVLAADRTYIHIMPAARRKSEEFFKRNTRRAAPRDCPTLSRSGTPLTSNAADGTIVYIKGLPKFYLGLLPSLPEERPSPWQARRITRPDQLAKWSHT